MAGRRVEDFYIFEKGMVITWRPVLRLVLKVFRLFVLVNLAFMEFYPIEQLGSLSLYNLVIPGRKRLPYGENPAESYNLSLNNIPAMLASHEFSGRDASDNYKIVVIGDSGTWGWLLPNELTLTGQINAAGLTGPDGRPLVAYNLGYPIMALSKDLLLLDAALALEPDLVLWPVTLQSFQNEEQLTPPLVQENGERMRMLIERYDLRLNAADPRLAGPGFWQRSILSQRRALADLLRLQLVGFSWAATGIDQAIPTEYEPRKSDFDVDASWGPYEEQVSLTADDLALDLLEAGIRMAGDVPVVIVNEPIYISDGQNSDIRYNAWYPRWVYDQYRELLGQAAAAGDWTYLDLWDSVEAGQFTDSPVHLTGDGVAQMTRAILPLLNEVLQ